MEIKLSDKIKKITGNDISAEIINTGGSSRRYYRLTTSDKNYIYCEYTLLEELERFIKISEILKNNNVNIQKILVVEESQMTILLEDLGAFSVFDFYHQNINKNKKAVTDLYKKIIDALISMQINCSAELKKIYPARLFNRGIYLWETDYFKNMVLDKYLNCAYDSKALTSAFTDIADTLDGIEQKYFIHRDFQSQNIIIKNSECYFIDYQTAYCGANFYDIASLLNDPYINADGEFHNCLYSHYKNKFSSIEKIDSQFDYHYELSRLQRLMQANAAYIKLGIIENKPFFKNYIDNTLKKISNIIKQSEKMPDYLKILFLQLEKDGKIKCAE